MADMLLKVQKQFKWFIMDPLSQMSGLQSVRPQQAVSSDALAEVKDCNNEVVQRVSGHACVREG